MLNISKNNIVTIIRGDTGVLKIDLDLEINSINNTTIYLGVYEPNNSFESSLIKKSISVNSNSISFTFSPTDTEFLLPGVYYYSIKMCARDENNKILSVNTIINKKKFIILE